MNGANIIIGYIAEEGSLMLIDEIGVGLDHYPDDERGGKNNILTQAGVEKEEKTIDLFFHRDHNEKIFQGLRKDVGDIFPSLKNIGFSDAWGGPVHR